MSRCDLPSTRFELGFIYTPEIVSASGEVLCVGEPVKNLIPQVGINHLAGILRGSTSVISAWYVGLYEGNFVPTNATSATDLQVSAQECTAYSETARPLWDNTFDGVSIITNLASRAAFTFNADKRVHGAFLAANSAKGSASGTLLSIARFPSPYDVPAGSTFRLGVSIALIPAS
jgi:hypothetical protein